MLAEHLFISLPTKVGFSTNMALKEKSFLTGFAFASEFPGDESMCRLLLRRGARVSATAQDNMTPLHFAALRGHSAVIALVRKKSLRLSNELKTCAEVKCMRLHFVFLICILIISSSERGQQSTPEFRGASALLSTWLLKTNNLKPL